MSPFRFDRLLLLLVYSSLLNCFLLPVKAQTTPTEPPVIPPPEPPAEPERLPSPEELLPPLTPPQQPLPQPLEIPGEIVVRQFRVVGSTIFSAEELAEVLAPFQNRPLSFNEFSLAAKAIADLYVENGYVTSGAFIPLQVIEDGIVTIRVVEGSIESIEIAGLRRLNSNYVRDRVEIASQTPLNTNRLLEALQLLQLDPLIGSLSAQLSPGSLPGRSILELELTEARAITLTAGLDNLRSPSVGSFRRIASFSHANLLGFGDRFDFSFYNTNGSNSIDNLRYTFPVNPYDGKISLQFRASSSELIQPAGIPLDIISDFRQYGFSYSQPLVRSPDREFILGFNLDRKETESSINGEPFGLLIDANQNGETGLSVLRLFQEFTTRDSRQVFAARSQFNFGLNNFQINLPENLREFELPDSNFISWRNQLQYLRLLNPDLLLLVRSDFQLADRPIFSLEKFGIGGLYTVRGYRQDAILADNGLAASGELRATLVRFSSFDGSLQLIPFVDFGTVWNNPGSVIPLNTTELASVGLGLSFNVGDSFTARVDWGQPLIEFDTEGDSLQENGVYFQLEYKASF